MNALPFVGQLVSRRLVNLYLSDSSVIEAEGFPENKKDSETESELRELVRKVLACRSPVRPSWHRWLTENIGEKAFRARKLMHQQRLACELVDAQRHGRYVVFLSLTYRDGEFGTVFGKESTAFKSFIQRLRRKSDGGYFAYFACLEYGSEKGREHIHVLT